MQISLKKGSLTAVADTMGGELISMQDRHKTEYIWQGDGAYWSGRNPILFPIVGKLKDDRVMIHGTAYNMKQHGFARSKEFTPVAQGEDFVELECACRCPDIGAVSLPFFSACAPYTAEKRI